MVKSGFHLRTICHRYFLVVWFLQVSIPSCLLVIITVFTLLSFRFTACLSLFTQAPFRFSCPFKVFLLYICNDLCIKLRKKKRAKKEVPHATNEGYSLFKKIFFYFRISKKFSRIGQRIPDYPLPGFPNC